MDNEGIADQLTHEAKSIMADQNLTNSEKIIVAVHAGYNYGVDHGVKLTQKQAWRQGYAQGYAAAERNCGAVDENPGEPELTWADRVEEYIDKVDVTPIKKADEEPTGRDAEQARPRERSGSWFA